jgi:hypothetical protein
VLAGAWRKTPPEPVSPEVDLVPFLLALGAGGLAHWRNTAGRGAAGPEAGPKDPLREAFRAYTLEAAVRETQLAQAARRLREAGVPALLAKGWAVGRHYAHPGLRPYGDLDFFVPATDHARAARALQGRPAEPPLPVDLHAGVAELDDRPPALPFERAVRLEVLGEPVEVMAPADHLRLVVMHLLRHGASRPPWLCDVGALLESAGPALDPEELLRGSGRRTRALLLTIGLAERLLGARVPAGLRAAVDGAAPLPRWLEPAVLARWGAGSAFRLPLRDPGPQSLARRLVERWPNAVEASTGLEAAFDETPRWPYQVAFAVVRAARYARGRTGGGSG